MNRQATPLLSAEFLERLEALREVAFRRPRRGELEGAGSGRAPEFDTHREYEPGDDPRYIDWNVFARLEKLLLRLYVADDEIQVCLLVDVSRSMGGVSPRKREVALKLAAAFGYLALAAGHSLILGAFADRLLARVGPYRSPRQFPLVLHFLSALPEGEGTDLAAGLGDLLAGQRGSLLLVMVSDFLQEGDLIRDLRRMASRELDLQLIQVLEEAELAPDLRGEYLLSDLEGPGSLTLFIDGELEHLIRRRIAGHVEELAAACRELGLPHLLVRASEDVERALIDYLLRRVNRGTGGA